MLFHFEKRKSLEESVEILPVLIKKYPVVLYNRQVTPATAPFFCATGRNGIGRVSRKPEALVVHDGIPSGLLWCTMV